jgi:hypothetical protein
VSQKTIIANVIMLNAVMLSVIVFIVVAWLMHSGTKAGTEELEKIHRRFGSSDFQQTLNVGFTEFKKNPNLLNKY